MFQNFSLISFASKVKEFLRCELISMWPKRFYLLVYDKRKEINSEISQRPTSQESQNEWL